MMCSLSIIKMNLISISLQSFFFHSIYNFSIAIFVSFLHFFYFSPSWCWSSVHRSECSVMQRIRFNEVRVGFHFGIFIHIFAVQHISCHLLIIFEQKRWITTRTHTHTNIQKRIQIHRFDSTLSFNWANSFELVRRGIHLLVQAFIWFASSILLCFAR